MLKSYLYILILIQTLIPCLGIFPKYNNTDIRALNNSLKIKISVICIESLDSIKTKLPIIETRVYMTENVFYEFNFSSEERLGEKCIQHQPATRIKVKLLKKTDEDIVARYNFDEMMVKYKETRRVPLDMINRISVITKDSSCYNIFFNKDSTYSFYSDTGVLLSNKKKQW